MMLWSAARPTFSGMKRAPARAAGVQLTSIGQSGVFTEEQFRAAVNRAATSSFRQPRSSSSRHTQPWRRHLIFPPGRRDSDLQGCRRTRPCHLSGRSTVVQRRCGDRHRAWRSCRALPACFGGSFRAWAAPQAACSQAARRTLCAPNASGVCTVEQCVRPACWEPQDSMRLSTIWID